MLLFSCQDSSAFNRNCTGVVFPVVEIRNASPVEFLPFGMMFKQQGSFWGCETASFVWEVAESRSRLTHATMKRADMLEWPEGLCDKDSHKENCPDNYEASVMFRVKVSVVVRAGD